MEQLPRLQKVLEQYGLVWEPKLRKKGIVYSAYEDAFEYILMSDFLDSIDIKEQMITYVCMDIGYQNGKLIIAEPKKFADKMKVGKKEKMLLSFLPSNTQVFYHQKSESGPSNFFIREKGMWITGPRLEALEEELFETYFAEKRKTDERLNQIMNTEN